MAGRRSVEVVFLADDTKLQSVLTQVHAGAQAAAGSVEHVGAASQHSGVQGREAFSTFNDALRATGQGMGPLGEAFDHLSILLDHVAEHSGNVRRQLAGIGLGITALGGIAFAAGQQDAQATAGLKSSVEAAGKSFEEYAPRLEETARSQARFGHTAADATHALSILTTATQDPIKALRDMHLVSEISAKSHISESEAAQKVAGIYAGNFKVLREYGIGKKDLIDVTKELTKAEHDQSAAAANLQSVQERSVQLNARIAQAEQQRVAAAQAAVASAQQADTNAQQAVQNAQQALDTRRQASQQADASAQQNVEQARAALDTKRQQAQQADTDAAQHAADVRSALDQKRADARQADTDAERNLADLRQQIADSNAAADRVATATQGVIDAKTRLEELEARIAQREAGTIADKYSLLAAEEAVARAKRNIADGQAKGTGGLDALQNAEQHLAELREQGVLRTKNSLVEDQALGHAREAVGKSTDHLAQVTEAGSGVAGRHTAQQHAMRVATEAAAKAHRTLTEVMSANGVEQQNLDRAVRQAAQAHRAAVDAMDAHGQAAQALDKAIAAQVRAHAASVAAMDGNGQAAQALDRAVRSAAAAHDRLAAAQAKAATAGQATLGEQQQQQRMAEEMTKAIKRQQAAGAEMAKAKADEAARGTLIDQALALALQRAGKAAEDQANTMAGRLKALLAQSENWVADFGQHYGGAAMIFGVAMSTIATLAETRLFTMFSSTLASALSWSGGMITRLYITVGQFAMGFAQMVASGATWVASSVAQGATFLATQAAAGVEWLAGVVTRAAVAAGAMVASFATQLVAAGVWAAGMLVAGATAMLPFLPIIAVVAALGVAAYELYKHWDAVWGFIKRITADAWQWIKSHVELILLALAAFFPPFAALGLAAYELYKHWDQVWGFIKDITSSAWRWIKSQFDQMVGAVGWVGGVFGDMGSFFGRVFGSIGGSLQWLSRVFSDIWGSIGSIVKGGANEVIQAVNFMINALNAIQVHIPSINLGPLGSTGSLDWNGLQLSQVPYLAAGSPFFGGGLAVVGDAGPELVQLPTGSQVYPNGKGPAGMGGGVHVELHLHAEGAYIMDRAGFIRDMQGPLADALTGVFRDRQRYGSHLLAR